jgi:peptide-methionine (S)-S-oxide reductase
VPDIGWSVDTESYPMTAKHEIATLAGGCFWCLEAVFEQIDGVESVLSGYCGGHVDHPDYAAVCRGRTGHAEAVQLTFDPARCSYRTLLEIFFAIHDPTTRDRQGNDVGTQYRSVIFYHTDEHRQVAMALITEFDSLGLWSGPIVTELLPAPRFFAAEAYHQQYFRRNPEQGYCQVVVRPKLAKLRKRFASLIKVNQ